MVHGVEEEGRGLAQRKPQGAEIEGLESGPAKICQPPLVVVLGAGDIPEHVGVVGAEDRAEHAAVTLHEVVGRDGIAVRPAGVGAQVKRVDEPVGRDFPAFRHAGNEIELRILAHQAFEKRDGEPVFRHAGHDLEIKILRLGAVADVEHLPVRRSAGTGRSGLLCTAGGEERESGKESEERAAAGHGAEENRGGHEGKRVVTVTREFYGPTKTHDEERGLIDQQYSGRGKTASTAHPPASRERPAP